MASKAARFMNRLTKTALSSLLLLACSQGASRATFEEPVVSDPVIDAPGVLVDEAGLTDAGPTDSGVTIVTTVYAHTDDTLYAIDPSTNAVSTLGRFSGTSGAGADKSVTDLAVNAAGDIYVNTMSVLYRATLPSTPGADVTLTKVADIATQKSQVFFALAFTPAGVLGPNEGLIGGDGDGELWSIDPKTGATQDLGSFGQDGPSKAFALSGDVVFYLDATGAPKGLATIRSCSKNGSKTCDTTNDYLAGIDMQSLGTAFSSGQPSPSLLSGIYGGSASSNGTGIGFGSVYGLGAWQGKVFGFTRNGAAATPTLLDIDPATGTGTVLKSGFAFTNGWSGAGVSTRVIVTVPPPPPAPH